MKRKILSGFLALAVFMSICVSAFTASAVSITGTLYIEKSQNVYYSGTMRYYRFTSPVTATYTVSSSGSYDTYGYIYDSNMNQLIYDDDSGATNGNFKMSYRMTQGNTYIIGVRLYNTSSTGSFSIKIESDIVYDITCGTIKNVDIESQGQIKYYCFKPTQSGTYRIASRGNKDTYGYLYDNNMNQLASNDDNGVGNNFFMSYYMQANLTYIIGAKIYYSSGPNSTGSFNICITTDSHVPPSARISCTNNFAANQRVSLQIYASKLYGYSWGRGNYDVGDNLIGLSEGTTFNNSINVSDPGKYYLNIEDYYGNYISYSVDFYKTTLNANGGDLSTNCSYIITQSGNKLDFPVVRKNGHIEERWATSATASKGNTYIYPNSNATYYPVWSDHHVSNKLTKATLSKNGKSISTCTACNFTKSTVIYYPKTIKLSKTSYTYNGKVQKPSVTVKDSKGKTIPSSNYTLTYPKGMKTPGTYTVKISFKGNYSGSKNLKFKISVGKVKNLKKFNKKGYKLALKWDAVAGASEYQLQRYDYSKKKWVSIGYTKQPKIAFTKIGKGTNKFRVRAIVKTGGKKYYGSYSNEIKVKV